MSHHKIKSARLPSGFGLVCHREPDADKLVRLLLRLLFLLSFPQGICFLQLVRGNPKRPPYLLSHLFPLQRRPLLIEMHGVLIKIGMFHHE